MSSSVQAPAARANRIHVAQMRSALTSMRVSPSTGGFRASIAWRVGLSSMRSEGKPSDTAYTGPAGGASAMAREVDQVSKFPVESIITWGS